ncbi:ABC transporter substrate-binding protein [Glycomyces buryatensis]|uniref:Extracellular solute-binding protein n=1 Tax=Glycomyces buryatensis TaxID=2570927 RepID=A0A4S8PRQ4_9ACTN|nr:extracellular solute-binding protein [Glycomyces buryatensis]THV32901.1 extracellular solute-binding protein [Glycomyces buryatensis]
MNPRLSRRSAAKGVAAALAGPLALSACNSGPPAPPTHVTQSDIDKAMSTPTEINFWTWVANIDQEVALFQELYPDITVNIVNAGQGAPHYAKLRTALRAGNGAPDVAQLEFQMIPSFTITDHLLDLRPFGAGDLADQFVDFAWSQVSGEGGEVWAIPQDTGPMGMLYRTDIFEAHNLEIPETWDEFAAAARDLHEADPEIFLTNLPPAQGGFYAALLWQAGSNPFAGSSGGDFHLDLGSEEAVRVTRYWSDLAEEGLVSVDPDYTDQWYQALNNGKYAAWLAPAWAPSFLSTAASSTSGNWRVAPLPQWDATAAPASSNWGGSTSAVMSTTENPIPAALFAQFLNTDVESTTKLANEQLLYPPTTALLEDPEFTGRPLEFYGGQEVNALFAEISETVSDDFQWSPFQDQVYAEFTETVGTAFTERTDAVAALEEWAERIKEYAEFQGFTVRQP